MGGGRFESFQSLMFLPCNWQAEEGQAKPNLATMSSCGSLPFVIKLIYFWCGLLGVGSVLFIVGWGIF